MGIIMIFVTINNVCRLFKGDYCFKNKVFMFKKIYLQQMYIFIHQVACLYATHSAIFYFYIRTSLLSWSTHITDVLLCLRLCTCVGSCCLKNHQVEMISLVATLLDWQALPREEAFCHCWRQYCRTSVARSSATSPSGWYSNWSLWGILVVEDSNKVIFPFPNFH